MKAAVLYEPKTPQVVEDVTLDEPRHGEVMVRVVAAGVCRSDHHVISGHMEWDTPIVLGHEGAGVVEKVGAGVTRVKAGDHVVFNFRPFCGYCRQCSTGHPNLCDHVAELRQACRLSKGDLKIHNFLGISCFAEYTVVPESGAIPISKDIPFDRAALVSCGVTTGVGAVINCAKVEPGASVVVIGAGGVGLNAIQGARLAHAGIIVAVDVLDHKLELARQFGATHTVNGAREDAVKRVKEIVGRPGADYAFEVIGSPAAIEQAWKMIRKGGMAVVVGVPPSGSHVSLSAMDFTDEKMIRGTLFGSARPWVDIPRLLDLHRAGHLKLDELITRTYPLSGVNDAFTALEKGEVARSVIIV